MNHDYYEDTRDCQHCGNEQTVQVEGSMVEASGECTNCGQTNWVYRTEELDSDRAETLMDAARDARFE